MTTITSERVGMPPLRTGSIDCGSSSCSLCYVQDTETPKKENAMSTAVVAKARTVDRTRSVTVKENEYTITLTEMQAGYLHDALSRHLNGEVQTTILRPIAKALVAAGLNQYLYAASSGNKQQSAKDAKDNWNWGFYGYDQASTSLKFAGETSKQAARDAGYLVY